MDNRTLRFENMAFAGTRGVSKNNRRFGFKPAFLNKRNGEVEVAKFENGSPAPMHIISWLPEEWAASRAEDGSIESLQPEIIAGFVADGIFYTRDEAAMC